MTAIINTHLAMIGASGLSQDMRVLARMLATGQAVVVCSGEESGDLLLTQCNGIDVQEAVKQIEQHTITMPKDFGEWVPLPIREKEPWRRGRPLR